MAYCEVGRGSMFNQTLLSVDQLDMNDVVLCVDFEVVGLWRFGPGEVGWELER
jgi:hypothetical protein